MQVLEVFLLKNGIAKGVQRGMGKKTSGPFGIIKNMTGSNYDSW